MHKLLLSVLGASLIAGSSFVYAELGNVMRDINQNYKAVLKAEEPQEFKQALEKMKADLMEAKKEVPPKLAAEPADSEKMKDYQHGLNVLLGQIDKAEQLADAGQFAQAKEEANNFEQTQNMYHKKYK